MFLKTSIVTALVALFAASSGAQRKTETPETVMVTYHAKAGADAGLARVIARHWQVAREMKLVNDQPHVTLRRAEEGGTCFVDIFTWRDASIPDNAPPAIQAIWAEMNKLVEARGGRPGIELSEMSIVTP